MSKELEKKIEKDFRTILNGEPKKLSDAELKASIIEYLSNYKICSIATCLNDIPRSTVLRYKSKNLTIFILTEGGGKMNNLRKNPNISATVYGEYTGFQSVSCVQMWGKAEIISPKETDKYAEVLQVMKTSERDDLKDLGVADMKINMHVIKINIEKAVYLNLPEGIINQTLIVDHQN